MTGFVAGFFAPWIIYALILLLHLVIPARKVAGYVVDPATGRPLQYRLNGPLVLVALTLLWMLSARTGVLGWDWLYVHRWSGLIGSGVLGKVARCSSDGVCSAATATRALPCSRNVVGR